LNDVVAFKLSAMKFVLNVFLFIGISANLAAQTGRSQFDPNSWGVVLEHPDMKNVAVQQDIPYLIRERDSLTFDLYMPPATNARKSRPAIIFMNGLGDSNRGPGLKSKGIYTSWPKLVAAHGYIGITMESDAERLEESFSNLFKYVKQNAQLLNIDATKLGIYAASANIRSVSTWLMKQNLDNGIRAAVFYYGEIPQGPYRSDLPVFFVVAEKDIHGNNYSNLWGEVLKNKSPWTLTLAKGLPHAFDLFADNDAAKKIILETIAFWKTNLDPVPPSAQPPSLIREILATQYDNDYAKIARLMGEWLQQNPNANDAAAFNLFATALLWTDQFAEADNYFRKSVAINPENKGVRLNMAITSYMLGNSQEAMKNLALYEEGSQPEGFTYGYVGRALLNKKMYDLATPYFEKAIALGPHRSDYYNLARCLAVKNQTKKAFENLSIAVAKGFNVKKQYEDEPDFESLRNSEEWQALLKKLE
jgi:tetratricopeptide (TPR) repeat protein